MSHDRSFLRRRLTTMLVVGGIVLAAAARPAAQAAGQSQPPPVAYRTNVTLVEVDAVVTDGEGRPVRDLTKDDFELLENGRPQPIDRVTFVEIPIERAAGAAASDLASISPSPGVRTNLQPFAGRLYVLLLDDVQTSPARAGRVTDAARRFVTGSLEPSDIAAVVHVSGSGAASQDFTADARLLLKAIDRFQGRKLRSETLTRIDEANRQRTLVSGAPVAVQTPDARDPDEAARAHDARRAFEAIAAVGRSLVPVRGRRKALLWFGEAVAYDMFDLTRAQAPSVLESARAAVAAATRANLAIYGVDARGLGGLGEETAQLSGVSIDPASSLGASGLQAELRRSQDHLRRIAAETGGFAVLNTDEFSRAFDRVVSENSAYYLLGYYPSDPADETYRRIEVKVRRPAVTVRARAGYLATRRQSAPERDQERSVDSPALRDALASPVPLSALPMAVHAAAMRGRGGKASVLVTAEYGAAAFAIPAAGGDRLLASVIAVDPSGKVEASDHQTIGLDVRPETRQAMTVLGFRTHARLDLPPGRYRLRVAGVLANGLAGSVHQDVDVPDFAAPRPTLSDLVVTSIVAGLVPTAQPDARMRDVLPAPPSATRHFRQDESIALFVEATAAGRPPAAEITFATTVRDAQGAVVFSRSDTRSAAQLADAGGGYTLQVALRQFEPGEYRLRVEALAGTASVGVREAAWQVWSVGETEPAAPPSRPAEAPSALPFVTVAHGAVSGIAEPREVVARDAEAWKALWDALPLRSPAPAVAFSSTMVVAVFLGARPTAGYEPEIVSVRRDGEALVVAWRERLPPGAGNPPAETTPFLVAGVPMHAGPVRFERRP